ncbi:Sodium/hydrogen exchanger 8-like [Homarus americanus]|uniref:Sodium/hydrogen exchanger n=1 Tax=Homarus americanus TaxID=6706 RepID=A0A8J5N151_HOMAM|nr:Sodium/hydrogen exchanger 8-like [Homarus americanus]
MSWRLILTLVLCVTLVLGQDASLTSDQETPQAVVKAGTENGKGNDTDKPPALKQSIDTQSGGEVKSAESKALDPTTPATTTTTEAPHLDLHVGNSTISNVCNITSEDYSKLTSFYPQHCSKDGGETEGQDTEGGSVDADPANETQPCHTSVDLPEMGAAEQEHLSSLSIFLILSMCVILIFFLLKTKLNYLPESVACVIVGGVIGLKEETFSPTVFFLVILPPIIFESGYNLHKGNFFQNIGSIIVFAVVGTLISALIVGGGVYLLGQADVVYELSFVESFAFGSLISAVDPVATLAIFHALNVDQVLYMLVFGESILNDAVSIVLTSTIIEMASPAMATMGSGEAVLYTVWRFCVMFFASAGIGVAFALLSALTLKYVPLREYTSLELCIIIIFIYAPYTLAEGIHLSGIMAILFNGIVMSHYTHFNMSPVMQITMQHLMRTLALIAECTFHLALVLWSIVLCLLGRAFNIFPLSWLVNKFRDHQINYKMMFIMWFSGLRGAIAYALALHLEFSDEKRHVIVTTTLTIVLFTIFCLGGSTMPLIKYLKADKRQKNRRPKERDKEMTLSKTREWGQALDSEHLSEFTEDESDTPVGAQARGFLRLDILYLRPFLIRRVTHQEVRSHANDLKKQCYQSINVQASESEEEEIFSAR